MLKSTSAPSRLLANEPGSSKLKGATLTRSPNEFGRPACPVSVLTALPWDSNRRVMYFPVYPNAPVTTFSSDISAKQLDPTLWTPESTVSHTGVRANSETVVKWSGRPDLNWGPRGPKPRALTRLRHAPAPDCRQIVGSAQPAVKRSGLESHSDPLTILSGSRYPHFPGSPVCVGVTTGNSGKG